MSLADAIKKRDDKGNNTINVSFKGIVDAYLTQRKEFHPFKAEIKRNKLIGFHPSGLMDACPRQIAFGFLHESKRLKAEVMEDVDERVIPPKLNMLFDFGHIIHMLIQYGYLLDYDKTAKTEVPVEGLHKKYNIAGTADIVIKLQDGKWYVGDIKTINSKNFWSLNSVEDVSPQYVIQLMLYIYGLGMKRGFIYYVNKDTSDTKEFFFDLDMKLIKDILATAEQAVSYLKREKSLPILDECKKTKGRYSRCSFSSLCFKCSPTKNDLIKYTIK